MDRRMLYKPIAEANKKNVIKERPLKIAIIISEFPSLNETFILDHITGLIDRGHEVHIYATAPATLPKVHEEVKTYRLLDRTVYRQTSKFMMPRNKILRALKAHVLLAEGLVKNPRAALNALNVFRSGKQAAYLGSVFRAAPFFGCGEYDIVHCHFPANGQLAVFLRDIGAMTGKIVTSFHGYSRRRFKDGKMSRVFDDLFEKGDLFLACSGHMKQWYDQVGWGGEKMIVHRYGVQVNRFLPSETPYHNHGPVRLLSVGRLVEKKGFEYAIRGVAKVLRQSPSLQYDIVGDGPERRKLERLITELGVVDHIRLLGWQDRAEVLRLLERANIFLAPSVTSQSGDQEGIPLVLHEAMALGLPVISTWHTGIPELVQDGESGFLVAERDVDAIADRLTHLVKHPESWRQMGQRGRQHIEQFNNLDRQNDRLVEIYKCLLKQG
jgi:colanic acid/amylovoran/stewartan biosynthesis glycosyltransferase WcaL/AmsK/CpsK